MGYSKTEETAIALAEPIAKDEGCYIYDAEFVKEGGLCFLRIYIDKDGGVDLDICEKVSRALSEKLDEKDPIKQNYYLEVSSPGIERKLKTKEHFERYMGETVDIGLYKAVNKSKTLTGCLKGFSEGIITVSVNDEDFKISQKETTYVKLHFDF